jgi:hypothetical protein
MGMEPQIPDPRHEADGQVLFAASPMDLSNDEPRRLSEFK